MGEVVLIDDQYDDGNRQFDEYLLGKGDFYVINFLYNFCQDQVGWCVNQGSYVFNGSVVGNGQYKYFVKDLVFICLGVGIIFKLCNNSEFDGQYYDGCSGIGNLYGQKCSSNYKVQDNIFDICVDIVDNMQGYVLVQVLLFDSNCQDKFVCVQEDVLMAEGSGSGFQVQCVGKWKKYDGQQSGSGNRDYFQYLLGGNLQGRGKNCIGFVV